MLDAFSHETLKSNTPSKLYPNTEELVKTNMSELNKFLQFV